MPTGAVKTKRQEGLWSRAKAIVDRAKAKGKVGDYWGLVMHVYQRLKNTKKSARGANVRFVISRDRLEKSRGLPVGHVSTRKDGSQWRKKAPGKWEMVRDPRGARETLVDPHRKPKPVDYGPGDLVDPHRKPKPVDYGPGDLVDPHRDRLPGGDTWWKSFGMKVSPGWDGKWRDTHVDDPERYNKEGVKRASKHMLRLREMRSQGKMPDVVVDAVCLFALTSIRTQAGTHERVWPKVSAWLQKPESERDPEELRSIMRPLGFQNTRLEQYKKSRPKYLAVVEGMRKHPTDGKALRRELVSNKETRVLGNAKISFMLEMLGYSDVGCIDARVVQGLTGAKGATSSKLQSKISDKLPLYEAFEAALQRSQAYSKDDPEEIRLGMAQWRLWDAQGGSDTDHGVFWKSLAELTGVEEFAKGGDLPSHLDTSMMLALGMMRSFDMGAGPAVYDGVPVMSGAAQKGLKKASSYHPISLDPIDRPSQMARQHEDSEHPYQGQVNVQGLIVCIENKRGSVRRGHGWKTKMGHHYGEIRDTRGADGDALDVYVGDNHDSNLVVVIHQKEPGTTDYDEDKVMVGFDRVVDALKAYRDHYDRPGFYQSHTTMTMPEFQRLLDKQGRRGGKLTKAQQELLDLVKAEKPIGHVSTYADGSQWKKTGPQKWEPVGKKVELDEAHQKIIREVFQQRLTNRKRKSK
jgi:hypothetical protein